MLRTTMFSLILLLFASRVPGQRSPLPNEARLMEITERGRLLAEYDDLVCKIYGLEERGASPPGVPLELTRDGHKYNDAWCDAASLDLVAKPYPR